jgi:hypothetical protein
MIFDVYRAASGTNGRKEATLELRPDFVASAVAGSLFVFSAVPDEPIPIGCRVEDGQVIVSLDYPIGLAVNVTIIVAGIHRHFPDWDMPHRTDAEAQKSWEFFNGEYHGKMTKDE